MVHQSPQPRAVQVAREHDFAAAAAFHHGGVVVQRQTALLLVLVVADQAVLAKDRLDVIVVRDLRAVAGRFGLVGRAGQVAASARQVNANAPRRQRRVLVVGMAGTD